MTVPAWKTSLLEKKHRRDEEDRKRQEEEEWQLEAMPAWKRELVLKKRAGVQLNSWRVTPRPAVSTNYGHSHKAAAVTIKPMTTAASKNDSGDKVTTQAPTQNHVHSRDEIDGHNTNEIKDYHAGVSEEHVASVHDNPFFKLERKRLSSGTEETPAVNWKPPSAVEVNKNTTPNTTGYAKTNTSQYANKPKAFSQNSENVSSMAAASNQNKPHHEPEVIIIPKPRHKIIVDNRLMEQKQEPAPKQIRLRTRSLSPATGVARRQASVESDSSSPRSPSSESPLHSPRSLDTENDENIERGKVNKLLGLFGKAVTPEDLRRSRLNSLERKAISYMKPKQEGVVKTSTVTEKSSKPPLPPSAVAKKAPVTPMTTVTTQSQYVPVSRPTVTEPSAELKSVEKVSVPSKKSEEPEKGEPIPIVPRRSKKKKLDASTIIRLDSSGPPTAKQGNYANSPSPTEDKPVKTDRADKEDQTDLSRHHTVQPLETKTDDTGEVIQPNTVSNIRHSFSEYNGPVPVPASTTRNNGSTKRRAPPPPKQISPREEEKSVTNGAQVTVTKTEQTTQKLAEVKREEAAPERNGPSSKPASEPVTKQPTQPTSVSKQPKQQASVSKEPTKQTSVKQPNQQPSVSKQPIPPVSKQPIQQQPVNKQTIIMTPVKHNSSATNSSSEVRQAVDELKSVGTTYRITPRTNKTTTSNNTNKKETKTVLAPKKSTNENDSTTNAKTETRTVTIVSNTKKVQPEQNSAVLPANDHKPNAVDIPVTNIDDIPVSNIDDFLSPPTSPTRPTATTVVSAPKEDVVTLSNNNTEKPKAVQNGTVIVNGTSEGESKDKFIEPRTLHTGVEPGTFVKPPLKRISGGKFKKITTYRFIGENAPTGKPSMLTKSRTSKQNIRFNDSATVQHMYPSEGSLLEDDVDAIHPMQDSDSDEDLSATTTKASLKSNTALSAHGGLQTYTPSHLQEAYMNSLDRRRHEPVAKIEEKKPREAEPPPADDNDDILIKPLDDKDADYFSTSSSSTALMF